MYIYIRAWEPALNEPKPKTKIQPTQFKTA